MTTAEKYSEIKRFMAGATDEQLVSVYNNIVVEPRPEDQIYDNNNHCSGNSDIENLADLQGKLPCSLADFIQMCQNSWIKGNDWAMWDYNMKRILSADKLEALMYMAKKPLVSDTVCSGLANMDWQGIEDLLQNAGFSFERIMELKKAIN